MTGVQTCALPISQNGICLKRSIHKLFHETYGFGNNTRQQFVKFSKDVYGITTFPWTNGNHEPSVTIEKVENELKTLKQQKEFEFKLCTKARNHIVKNGDYQNCRSSVTVFCLKHNSETIPTYTNYKKSKFGCFCCVKEKVRLTVIASNRLRAKTKKG